jgi:predicted AlkP superfamily phosphohydrolase/phosphomutase
MAVKTLVIGIDGADWSYLDQVLDECPALARLKAQGVSGRMRSTIPPLSPAAWSSFITGKGPAGHGIYDWEVRPQGGAKRPVNANDRKATPFWRYLNLAGCRVGVMGIPVTYPTGAIDGFVLGGFDSPWGKEGCCFPNDLGQRIEGRFGQRARTIYGFANSAVDAELLRDESERSAMLTEVALYLAAEYAVECLVLNYMAADHVNHAASRMETVLACYRHLDAQVARLVEGCPGADVVVISDHGSKRVRGGFLVGEVLHDLGLITYRNGSVSKDRHAELLVRYLQGTLGLRGLPEKLLRRLMLHALHLAPGILAERFWRRVRERDPRVFHLYWNIDKAASVVDYSGGTDIQFYVNRERARERGLGEIGQVLAALKERLGAVEEPGQGRPMVRAFHELKTELKTGMPGESAPDLLASLEGSAFCACLSYPMSKEARVEGLFVSGERRYAHLMQGTHARHGIYICAGKSFAEGLRGPDIDLHDMPLLLLTLHGVPVPEDFEGRLWGELLAGGAAQEPPRQASLDAGVATAEAEVTEEVISRLRSMGYVD